MRNLSLRLITVAALLLGGCQAFAPHEERSDYAAYTAALADARKNPPRAFEFKCPATGCNFTEFTAYQTGNTQGEIKAPAPTPKAEHPIVGALREAKETVLGLAPFAMPVLLVNGIMNKTSKMFEAVAARPPTTTTTNTTNNTLTGDGSAMGSSTASTATSTTNTTDRHDSTISNSNNTNRNCATGAPTGTTNPTSGPATC